MISPPMIERVIELLAEGRFSHRKIARLTGVSRGTVGAVARGKQPKFRERLPRDTDSFRPLGPPRRCPECGGKVYMPCLLCRLRASKAKEQADALAAQEIQSLAAGEPSGATQGHPMRSILSRWTHF